MDKKTKRTLLHIHSFFPLNYDTLTTPEELRTFAAKTKKEHLDAIIKTAATIEKSKNSSTAKSDNLKSLIEKFKIKDAPLEIKDLAVNGKTLLKELDATPGKWLGDLLEQLVTEVIQSPNLNTQSQLFAKAKEFYKRQ